jgi:hypothetical protein
VPEVDRRQANNLEANIQFITDDLLTEREREILG